MFSTDSNRNDAEDWKDWYYVLRDDFQCVNFEEMTFHLEYIIDPKQMFHHKFRDFSRKETKTYLQSVHT